MPATAARSGVADLITQARRLEPLGWEVVPTKSGVTIRNPHGDTAGIHSSGGSDRRTLANTVADLNRIGLTAALAQLDQENARKGRARTTAARAAAASVTAVTKPAAAAAFSSASTDNTPRPSVVRGQQTRVETLTPERAQELLDRPTTVTLADGTQLRQRSVNEVDVANFVKIIQAGRWLTMPPGISLAADGSRLDGGHRLTAIARAGVAVDVYIHYNVPAEAFEAFDTGRRRSSADTLRMAGFVTDVLALTSAAKLMLCYDEWLAAPFRTAQWSTWSRLKYTNADVRDGLARYPGLPDDVRDGRAIGNRCGLVPAAVAVFRQLARRAWPEGQEVLTDFCAGLRTGEDIRRGDANYCLREWAQRTPARTIVSRREANLLLVLMGWNTYAAGKSMLAIPRHTPDRPMVTPYVPKTR